MNFRPIDTSHITVSEYINSSVRFDTPILYIIRNTTRPDLTVSFIYYHHKPEHCSSDAKLGCTLQCTIVHGIASDDVIPYKNIPARRMFF